MQVSLSRRHPDDQKEIPTYYQTVTGSFFDIHRVILSSDWCPSLFHPMQKEPRDPLAPYRRKDKFLRAHILGLDVDIGVSAIEAHELLLELDLTHIIAATQSHQIEKAGQIRDRYRILIPAKAPTLKIADYFWTAQTLGSQLGADTNAFNGVMSFRPSREILYSHLTGVPLEWLIAPYDATEDGAEYIEGHVKYYLHTYDPYRVHPLIVESLRTANYGKGRSCGLFYDSVRLAISGAGEDEILRLIESMKSPYLRHDESWNRKQLRESIRNGVQRGKDTRKRIEDNYQLD